jgi:PAS domain S-box-containing protein
MQSGGSDIETVAVPLARTDGLKADGTSADPSGILDAVNFPIIVVGRECKIVRMNQAAADVLGLGAPDIGRVASEAGLFSEVKDIQQLCAEVMAEGVPCQREIRNGDRWFVLRIAPYTGSSRQVEGAVLTFTNVTAFRASVAQAIHEREFTKTILNTVAQPLVVVDDGWRVQTANRAFYSMFGVSREATQSMPLCNLGNHDWNAVSLWASLKASLLEKRQSVTMEVECDFRALGRRTVLLDAHPLAVGRDALILVGLRDITERKRQEEKLEKMVAERTTALRETVGELEAFSYSIAHDMRAPLRSMQSFARIIAEEHAGQLDPEALDYLRRITAAARRLDRLIQDVLNYSKVVNEQMVIEPVDLDRLTREIIETYPGWQPPKADIEIQSALPKVLGNDAFLTQCISNLVSNAIKFVLSGTVPRVRIWAEELMAPAARCDRLTDGGVPVPQVRLYFQDNGIGIGADQGARIFRMFERIHPSSEYEGTGIGLTIARRAVERMGGAIGFESDLGKGSKFWIQLKRA